jgi:hypothetical protein
MLKESEKKGETKSPAHALVVAKADFPAVDGQVALGQLPRNMFIAVKRRIAPNFKTSSAGGRKHKGVPAPFFHCGAEAVTR